MTARTKKNKNVTMSIFSSSKVTSRNWRLALIYQYRKELKLWANKIIAKAKHHMDMIIDSQFSTVLHSTSTVLAVLITIMGIGLWINSFRNQIPTQNNVA